MFTAYTLMIVSTFPQTLDWGPGVPVGEKLAWIVVISAILIFAGLVAQARRLHDRSAGELSKTFQRPGKK